MTGGSGIPRSPAVRVRNLREGEADSLPLSLLDTGMPYLDPPWVWIVEAEVETFDLSTPPAPFALIVTSFAHGWLVLWRVLAASPLPPAIPLTWFMEALPQVFAEAAKRGCVGFLTLLADDRPAEARMARIVASLPGCSILPFQGSMGVGPLAGARGGESQ